MANVVRISDWSSDVCASDLRPHPDIAATRCTAARDADAAGHIHPRTGSRAARYARNGDAAPGPAGRAGCGAARNHRQTKRTCVLEGTGVTVRVVLGGTPSMKKKNQ